MLRRRILAMRIRIGGIGIIMEKTRRGQNRIQVSIIIIKRNLPNTGIKQRKDKKKNKNNQNQIQSSARPSGTR